MKMEISEAEKAFRAEIRAFVRAELPDDIRAKVDAGIELDREEMQRWMRIMGRKGWLASNWDKKDGGPGFTNGQKSYFEEELFLSGAPRMAHYGTRMVGPVLLAYGSDAQKKEHLPGILTSDVMWCQGYSEPGSGSDLASLQLSARLDGDHYIVNGTKIWTSMAHYADMMFALVRTSKEKKKQDGITVLLIDMKTPGLTVRPLITIDGRHNFNQEFFDDVKVPVANRVGQEGAGWTIAKYLLGHERSNVTGVAMARRQMAKLRRIMQDQQVNGALLAEEADFRRKVEDAEAELASVQMLANRVLASASADKPIGAEASVLKYKMAVIQQTITELMMESGAYYAQPWDAERLRGQPSNAEPVGPDYRFRMSPEYFLLRGTSIAGGSNEIQKNIIAKNTLGL
jgi:alkylation response protein AidB-like acyl-CoA dehydrogenase